MMEIFRAYDIRGIYGQNLTEDVMTRIGKAVGTYVCGEFTVGRDFVGHNVQLEHAFTSGLIQTGSNAFSVGACPIGLCVFSNWKMKNDVAAYITASHLPSQWSGVKLFHTDGVGFSASEIKELQKLYSLRNFKNGQGLVKDSRKMEKEYMNYVTRGIHLRKVRVVVDFGNGTASLVVPRILKRIGVDATFLHDNLDPRSITRDPEPKPESLSGLCEKVIREGADLGIAYDADCDRVIYVDDQGKVIMTEHVAILFIRELMKTNRGPVVVNVECSNIIENEVRDYGENVFWIPVGYTFMIQETKKRNAVLGVEKSGHICIPTLYWFDDAIMNSVYMINILSKMNRAISDMLKAIPAELHERIEIDVKDEMKFEVVDEIRKTVTIDYENTQILDGVRIEFPDSWVLIRASNTSPRVRILIEAKNGKRLDELKKEILHLVNSVLSKYTN